MPENLYKSRKNKVFAGVCGGIAEYFKVDATLIRLAWALAFFVGGSGLILYILAMIIIPENPQDVETRPIQAGDITGPEEAPGLGENSGAPQKATSREDQRRQILGLILVAAGLYFLLRRFFPFFDFGEWWPLVLIIIGGFLLLQGRGGGTR